MSDELKSAWELALEKLEAEGAPAAPKLTEEQKEEITDLRRRHQAKIAETEIGIQGSLQKAAREGDFDEVQRLRDKLAEQRRKLNADLEARLEEVRRRRE